MYFEYFFLFGSLELIEELWNCYKRNNFW